MRADFNRLCRHCAPRGVDMKATRSLHGTPKLEFDLGTYLQQLWRHVDEREKRQASPADAYRKVRLDCTGQFVDIESIGLVVVRSSMADVEIRRVSLPAMRAPARVAST